MTQDKQSEATVGEFGCMKASQERLDVSSQRSDVKAARAVVRRAQSIDTLSATDRGSSSSSDVSYLYRF